MCYSNGAVETYVSTCPMCKAFPSYRCPHQRDVCRNRTNHPRVDILFLKNAEMDLFNGCGFCKWARTKPPPKMAGINNQGYPGCCRPPSPSEYHLIGPTEWRAVNLIHHTPIPSDVKGALDKLSQQQQQQQQQPAPNRPSGPKSKPSTPPLDRDRDRRAAAYSTPLSKSGVLSSSGVGSTKHHRSGGGSPSSSSGSSGSPPSSPRVFDVQAIRDALTASSQLDTKDGKHASCTSSPGRRSLDLDPRTDPSPKKSNHRQTSSSGHNNNNNNSTPRPSKESRKFSSATVGRVVMVGGTVHRGLSNSTTASTRSKIPLDFTPPPQPLPPAKPLVTGSISSGSSSSDSTGSASTIMSEGAFTDYLSDESEVELQRQAEARAALLAQNQAEEMEFRAARQRLVGIDLRPDDHWKGTNPSTRPATKER